MLWKKKIPTSFLLLLRWLIRFSPSSLQIFRINISDGVLEEPKHHHCCLEVDEEEAWGDIYQKEKHELERLDLEEEFQMKR